MTGLFIGVHILMALLVLGVFALVQYNRSENEATLARVRDLEGYLQEVLGLVKKLAKEQKVLANTNAKLYRGGLK